MVNNIKKYVFERFVKKFDKKKFNKALKEYEEIKAFNANQNINDIYPSGISKEAHFIMRTVTQYYIQKAFEAMRVNLDDPNVKEDLENGNIGSPGRIAKIWVGKDPEDYSELGSGRWTKKPRLAKFPNTHKDKFIITKRVDIISNCSHHFIPFSTLVRSDSYAIISYIPDKFVLGISKLQRLTNWISRRFFLQEDLTRMLYEEISKAAETESVYIKLFNLVHGCEVFRGVQSSEGAFTSEYFGGDFKDINLRNQIK